jgi:invasion protein IalB
MQLIALDGNAKTIDVPVSDLGAAYRSSPSVADTRDETEILAAITGDPVSGSKSTVAASELAYSRWGKFCGKSQDAKQACYTGMDVQTKVGDKAVAAALIEPEGDQKKILRLTLPSPVRVGRGMRMTIDQSQPRQAPIFTCFPKNCMADIEASPALINELQKGTTLTIGGVNMAGYPISFALPLADFAKANEASGTERKLSR